MRIATWNLGARTSAEHEAFLADLGAEVLLLTELPPSLPADARSEGVMSLGQHFAGLRGVRTVVDSELHGRMWVGCRPR